MGFRRGDKMNIHVMLMLLSLTTPATKPIALIGAPQCSAPVTMHEYRATGLQLRAERVKREKIMHILKARV